MFIPYLIVLCYCIVIVAYIAERLVSFKGKKSLYKSIFTPFVDIKENVLYDFEWSLLFD